MPNLSNPPWGPRASGFKHRPISSRLGNIQKAPTHFSCAMGMGSSSIRRSGACQAKRKRNFETGLAGPLCSLFESPLQKQRPPPFGFPYKRGQGGSVCCLNTFGQKRGILSEQCLFQPALGPLKWPLRCHHGFPDPPLKLHEESKNSIGLARILLQPTRATCQISALGVLGFGFWVWRAAVPAMCEDPYLFR